MSAPYDPDDALTGGQWINDRGIMRWEPDANVVRTFDPDAIACPTCKATASQSCRTPAGAYSGNTHVARLTPRVCGCGAELTANRKKCDDCRAVSKRATRDAYEAKSKAREQQEVAA